MKYLRFSQVYFILICLCLIHPLLTHADDAPPVPTEAEKWIQKIEDRSGGWIAYRSEIEMSFIVAAQQPAATCHGQMLYDRFRNRLRLECANERGEILFTFKAFDEKFELSLKDAGTVYRGDIFEPEISPEIENHLAPLELYRAVKLSAIPADRAEIKSEDLQGMTLQVWSQKENVRYVSRMISASVNGDVPLETWFNQKQVPLATIRRGDYRRVQDDARIKDGPAYFPYQIQLVTQKDSAATKKETVIAFKNITLLSKIDEKEWG